MTTTEQHRAMGQVNLIEQSHAIESRHPGWHLWRSDMGKLYATRDYRDACGCGVTVTAGWPLIEHEIAVWERAHDREMTAMATSLVMTGAAGGMI